MLGVWEQQAREGLIQFIGTLKVNVIYSVLKPLIYPYKVGFYYSINLILYIKILYSYKYDWKRKENRLFLYENWLKNSNNKGITACKTLVLSYLCKV